MPEDGLELIPYQKQVWSYIPWINMAKDGNYFTQVKSYFYQIGQDRIINNFFFGMPSSKPDGFQKKNHGETGT